MSSREGGKVMKENRKYFGLNDNRNTTHKILWAAAGFKGKFIRTPDIDHD